VKEIHTHLN
jgi:hypothetical protein